MERLFSTCKICTNRKFKIKNRCKKCNKCVCKKCNKEISCCPFCRDDNLGEKEQAVIQEEMYSYHEEENIRLGLEEAMRLHEELNEQTIEETNKELTYEEQVVLTQIMD